MKTLGAKWLIKTVYGFCCTILVIYLLVKIKECIENYIAGSTYYNTSVVRQDDVTFPELTLCSDEHLGLKANVLKVRGQIYENFNFSSIMVLKNKQKYAEAWS